MNARVKPAGPTPLTLEELAAEWKDCRRCPLGSRAVSHVLWEFIPENPGDSSVDIAFIGEGPGASEDALGQPFIGPAGELLREAIQQSGAGRGRVLLANLLACRPTNPDSPGANRPPAPSEIAACMPRLAGLLRLTQPRVVFATGQIPGVYVRDALRLAVCTPFYFVVLHPSFVLRDAGSDWRTAEPFKRYVQTMQEYISAVENCGVSL